MAEPPANAMPMAASRMALGATVALAWVLGSAAQLQLPALWPPQAVAALALAGALLALAALVLGRARAGPPPKPRAARAAAVLGAIAAAALLGFASTHHRAALRVADGLPAALEGQDLLLRGTVASLPREGLQGVRFEFEVETAWHRGQPVRVPARVSLGWWRGLEADAMLAAPPRPVRAGQRWQFTARLAQPHGAMNPHGFDLELWLFEQGLRASGSVRDTRGTAPPVLLQASAAHPVERLRQAVRDAIQARVPDAGAAGVLAALAVGDQAAIERGDWALFRDTGVAHLMSISGLHVTMFAWLAGALVGALWRRHPVAPRRVPAPVAGRWAGLLLAAAYALLAGWGVPAQRTVAMIAVVVLLRHFARRWPLPAVLGTAGWVVVLGDPWALLQPGFWLSFVAVGLLAASGPVLARADAGPAPRGAWLRAALQQQAVATVGLAPLSLLFFQQISLVGFVANLVAIPLVTLLVTPLALVGVLLPPLWSLGALVVAGLEAALAWMAATPLAVWHAAAAPPWAVAAGLLGAVVAVLPWPWRLRALALPLMLPLLAPPVTRPAPGHFELLGADVGQGTAVVLRTATHTLLFDSGPAWGTPGVDAGERVLVPLLRALGERHLDELVLSHRDTDHTGGAASLAQALPVRALRSSLEDGHALRGLAPHTPCEAGQRWRWDGVDFEVLHPTAAALAAAQPSTRANTLSCVLRVQAGGASVLLTGDIEAPQEAALVREAAARLPSTVLWVPHHGSRTSSTPGFIAAVAPRVAVVQAAHRSRFGHPSPVVLARYAEAGVPVVTTAACGAWHWSSATAQAACTRPAQRRYWHHPGAAPQAPAAAR
jgi:competence protein ComEC